MLLKPLNIYHFIDEDKIIYRSKNKLNKKEKNNEKKRKFNDNDEKATIIRLCKNNIKKKENGALDLFTSIFLSNDDIKESILKKIVLLIKEKINKNNNQSTIENFQYYEELFYKKSDKVNNEQHHEDRIKHFIEFSKRNKKLFNIKIADIGENETKKYRYLKIIKTNYLMSKNIHNKSNETIDGKPLSDANRCYYKKVYTLTREYPIMMYYPYSTLYNLIREHKLNNIMDLCASLITYNK